MGGFIIYIASIAFKQEANKMAMGFSGSIGWIGQNYRPVEKKDVDRLIEVLMSYQQNDKCTILANLEELKKYYQK